MAFSKPHRISSHDCFKTYRQAFEVNFPWDRILPEHIDTWLSVYCKGTNSNKRMAFTSMLTITSSFCGPKTKVCNEELSFSQSFNTNIINVSDPGGGKTTTFNNFLQPGIEVFKDKTNKSLNLENYTLAGLHNQQIANKGYGLIASDEGHRFFSQLKSKISKGDNEVPLLCKMWSGKGDSSTLNSGNRNLDSTSLSLNIMIQPEPLLNDMPTFLGNDGFLERMLFMVSKPSVVHPYELSENFSKLQDMPLKDITSVYESILTSHKGGKTYRLSRSAQDILDSNLENYASYLERKYSSEAGDSLFFLFHWFIFKILITYI